MKNNSTKENTAKKFDVFKDVMTDDEASDLMESIVTQSEFDASTIYGLFFLLDSFCKLVETDNAFRIEDLCNRAIDVLYKYSANMSEGKKRLGKNIAAAYRSADFTAGFYDASQPFVDAEYSELTKQPPQKPEEIATKDEGDTVDELSGSKLALVLDSLLDNDNLPAPIHNAIYSALGMMMKEGDVKNLNAETISEILQNAETDSEQPETISPVPSVQTKPVEAESIADQYLKTWTARLSVALESENFDAGKKMQF